MQKDSHEYVSFSFLKLFWFLCGYASYTIWEIKQKMHICLKSSLNLYWSFIFNLNIFLLINSKELGNRQAYIGPLNCGASWPPNSIFREITFLFQAGFYKTVYLQMEILINIFFFQMFAFYCELKYTENDPIPHAHAHAHTHTHRENLR